MKAKRSSTNDIVLISKFCPLIFPNFPPALLLTYCRLFRHHLWFFKKSLYPPSIPGLSWDPVFGRLVNPISTGGHIMPTTLLRSPPPDFQNFRWPCILFLCISCTTAMHCLKICCNFQCTSQFGDPPSLPDLLKWLKYVTVICSWLKSLRKDCTYIVAQPYFCNYSSFPPFRQFSKNSVQYVWRKINRLARIQ